MAAAARSALEGAGIAADDVAHLDLYSCFASSVCFALDALGIPQGDPRASAITQTGGLPYHGGPRSHYVTHSPAAMTATRRTGPASHGAGSGVCVATRTHTHRVGPSATGAP